MAKITGLQLAGGAMLWVTDGGIKLTSDFNLDRPAMLLDLTAEEKLELAALLSGSQAAAVEAPPKVEPWEGARVTGTSTKTVTVAAATSLNVVTVRTAPRGTMEGSTSVAALRPEQAEQLAGDLLDAAREVRKANV